MCASSCKLSTATAAKADIKSMPSLLCRSTFIFYSHLHITSRSNMRFNSSKAVTHTPSARSLAESEKSGSAVSRIIEFAMTEISSITKTTFTEIRSSGDSWMMHVSIDIALESQDTSSTSSPQRLKPKFQRALDRHE